MRDPWNENDEPMTTSERWQHYSILIIAAVLLIAALVYAPFPAVAP